MFFGVLSGYRLGLGAMSLLLLFPTGLDGNGRCMFNKDIKALKLIRNPKDGESTEGRKRLY